MRDARFVITVNGPYGLAAHDIVDVADSGHVTRCGKTIGDGFTANVTRPGWWLCAWCWTERETLADTLTAVATRINHQAIRTARTWEDLIGPVGRPTSEAVALGLEARMLMAEVRRISINEDGNRAVRP